MWISAALSSSSYYLKMWKADNGGHPFWLFPNHWAIELGFNLTLVLKYLNALQEAHEVVGFALYLKFKKCHM